MTIVRPRAQSVWRLAVGPGLMVLARLVGALAALLMTMQLTRTMGAAGTGQVSVAVSLAMVLALACTLNIESGAVRFMVQDIAAGRFAQAAGYIRFSRRFILISSCIVTVLAALWLWGTDRPLLSPMGLAVVAAPFLAWMRLGAGIALGFSRAVQSVLPRTLFRPLFAMLGVTAVILIWGTITPMVATGVFVASCLVAVLIQIWLLRADTIELEGQLGTEASDSTAWRDWVKIGLTLGLNVLFIEYAIYVTVLSAAPVLTNVDTARLDVLLKLIAFLRFGMAAINQYFSPQMSRAMGNGNIAALSRLIAVSGAMRLAVAAAGGLIIVILGQWVLSLFGPEFAPDYGLFCLLFVEIVLIAIFGPGPNVVGFSGRPHMMLPVLLASLALLTVGTLVAGYFAGLTGVIVMTILARFAWVAGTAFLSRRLVGVDVTLMNLLTYLRRPRS